MVLGKLNDGVDITDIKPLTEEETVGHDDNSEVSLSYISEEDEVDHERPEESSEVSVIISTRQSVQA